MEAPHVKVKNLAPLQPGTADHGLLMRLIKGASRDVEAGSSSPEPRSHGEKAEQPQGSGYILHLNVAL